MFTFGRDRERSCAVQYVRNPAERPLAEHLVDVIHDVLEGTADVKSLAVVLKHNLAEGGSGVWEQAGSWLRKLAVEYPELHQVWRDLASHPSASVRYRVAPFLCEMPHELRIELAVPLVSDQSWKVRRKAAGALADARSPEVLRLLQQALENEEDRRVIESLSWAVEMQRGERE
jgi:HEAT repeat protein